MAVASCAGGATHPSAVATDQADPGLIASGAEVYARSCAACHGDDLRGTDRGPSPLSRVYEPGHHADEAFRRAIAVGSPQHHWGFGDMPAVPGLGAEEVDAVIAYVREQQRTEGFID